MESRVEKEYSLIIKGSPGKGYGLMVKELNGWMNLIESIIYYKLDYVVMI